MQTKLTSYPQLGDCLAALLRRKPETPMQRTRREASSVSDTAAMLEIRASHVTAVFK